MDELLWWGLNLASLGFSHLLLPLLQKMSIREAFKLDADGWQRAGLPVALAIRLTSALSRVDLERQKRLGAQHQAVFLSYDHAQFPARLREIEHAPLALAVVGRTDLLNAPRTLAMVGSRNATEYGREVAWQFSHQLARAGVVVVSGMALGIDARSHQGALDAGGDTVAFLGCGLDVCYPTALSGLRGQLARQGALVSQYAFECRPLGHHFPYRNRLISGLSDGVLVVEGQMSSGSLHTVDWALQQGRNVYTVPGSIYSTQSILPHYLLQVGATPVTCPQDLLPPVQAHPPDNGPPLAALTAAEQAVLQQLDATPVAMEQLCAIHSQAGPGPGFSVSEVLVALMSLELQGLVRRSPSNRYWRDRPAQGEVSRRRKGEAPG